MNSLLSNWREAEWAVRVVYAILFAEILIAICLIWSLA